MRKETPAAWRSLMDSRGISSLRALAEKAGVSHTVTSRMVNGTGIPKDESVTAVAEALNVQPATIYKLLQQAVPAESGPWYPPAESARLTASQRDALAQLIRSMVPPVGTPATPDSQTNLDLAAKQGRNLGREAHERTQISGEENQETNYDRHL